MLVFESGSSADGCTHSAAGTATYELRNLAHFMVTNQTEERLLFLSLLSKSIGRSRLHLENLNVRAWCDSVWLKSTLRGRH
jgi:hypothetical protein